MHLNLNRHSVMLRGSLASNSSEREFAVERDELADGCRPSGDFTHVCCPIAGRLTRDRSGQREALERMQVGLATAPDQAAGFVATQHRKRPLMHKGWVTSCQPNGTTRRRYLALEQRLLSCYETEYGASSSASPEAQVVLTPDTTVTRKVPDNVKSCELSKAEMVVVVKTPEQELWFKSDDGRDTEWLAQIQQAIKSSRRPSQDTSAAVATPSPGIPLTPSESVAPVTPGNRLSIQHGLVETVEKAPAASGSKQPRTTARPRQGDGHGAAASSASPSQHRHRRLESGGGSGGTSANATQATPWGETGMAAGGLSKKGSDLCFGVEGALTPSLGDDSGLRLAEAVNRDSSRVIQSDTVTHSSTRSVGRDASGKRIRTDGAPEGAPHGSEDGQRWEDDDRMMGWVKMSWRKYYAVLNVADLELYTSTSEFHSQKSPKEVITLTAECTVESRKLGPSRSKPASGSQEAIMFTDAMEPDSVIDLQLVSKLGATPRVVTLQCFSVEEENKWISHLQIAIGALTGPLSTSLPLGKHDKDRRTDNIPRACCAIS